MEKDGSSRPQESTSRRNFLRKYAMGSLATAAVGGTGALTAREIRRHPTSAEAQATPEVLAEPPEFMGFNTNLYPEQVVEHDLSLDAFKEDIDTLAKEGMNMIRFSLRPYAVVESYDPKSESVFTWNEQKLADYDEAITYAKAKGIDIFLVLNTPEHARNASSSEYMNITSDYFSFIANRYKDQLTMVQLFNEPNIHHFRDYSATVVDNEYLESFREAAFAASRACKAANPAIQTTINVGGWPLNEGLVAEWERFFDSNSDLIDVISIDLYPDDNKETISHLQEWLQRLKNRFGKPVMVAEIGLPTGSGRFTEDDQGKYLNMSIEELKKAGVVGILPYEIRDEARNPNSSEASFGIKRADGSHKKSYNTVMDALKPEEEKAKASPQVLGQKQR